MVLIKNIIVIINFIENSLYTEDRNLIPFEENYNIYFKL